MVEILALVLQHDEQAVLCAVHLCFRAEYRRARTCRDNQQGNRASR
jgi:hypothetical protein